MRSKRSTCRAKYRRFRGLSQSQLDHELTYRCFGDLAGRGRGVERSTAVVPDSGFRTAYFA
jgi:hypothetical protein